MSSSKIFLGIDVGHTVVKVAAYDEKGNEIANAGYRVELKNPKPGYYETDIKELFSSTLNAIKEIGKKISLHDVAAIGLCGGGDGFYALDRNLNPIGNGIPGLDRRAINILRKLKEEGLYDILFNKIGMPVLPGSIPIVLRWFKENDRNFYDKIAVILARKDIVRYMLTGDISTEISDACFGVLNVYTQEYDREIFEIVGVEDKFDALPELRPNSYDVAGYITEKVASITGLKAGTPVIAGAHDACCNTIGTGAIEPHVVCTGGGTWSINLTIVDKPILNPKWSCEAFVKKGTWILEGSSPTATVSLDWFVDIFMKEEKEKMGKLVYKYCDEIVEKTETGLIFLPYLMGLPWGYPFQENASGAFIGIRLEDSKKEFLRAIFEGITFVHALHINEYEKYIGVNEVRFTGGAARSKVWTQMLADTIGKKVVTVDKEETGCFGAAILAMWGIGEIRGLDEVKGLVRIKEVFYPKEENREKYERKYMLFVEICQMLEKYWGDLEKLRG